LRLSFKRLLPYAWFISLSFIIVGKVLFSDGYYFAIDWVFPPDRGVDAFYGLLGDDPFLYSLMPVLLLIEAAEHVISASSIQKIIIFLIFFISGVGGYKLLERFSPTAGYFAGTLYAVNPFTYVRFLSGQWVNLMAYAFMPLATLSFIQLLNKPDRRTSLRCLMFSTLVTAFSPQFALLTFILYFLLLIPSLISHMKSRAPQSLLKYLMLYIIFYSLINAYWIMPLLLSAEGTPIAQISNIDAYVFSAKPQIRNIYVTVMSMHGFWRGGYTYTFDLIPGLHYLFVIFLLLALIGLIGDYRSNGVNYTPIIVGFGLCMIFSIILATGVYGFSAPLYLLLFEKLTILHIFRDTQKFVSLLILCYAYLGGIGLTKITHRIKNSSKGKTIQTIVTLIAISLPLTYQFNMLVPFNGQIITHDYPKAWYDVNNLLNADREDFNVLFLPWHKYMTLSWVGSNIANPAKYFFQRPIIQGENIEVGPIRTQSTNPAQRYIDFLLSKTQQIDNFGELISPLNVKYILLAKEADYLRYNFLYNQTDLKPIFENEAFTIFINEKYVGRIYQPEHLIAVNGYEDILQASKTIDISRSAIITSNTNLQIPEAPFKKINYTTENPITYNIKEEHTVIAFTPPNLNSDGWVLDGTKSLETLGFQAVYTNKHGRTITYERFNTYLTAYTTSTVAALAATYLALREKANQASQKAKAPQAN